MACLSPRNQFSAFDSFKLIILVQFYPDDFINFEITTIDYVLDAQSDEVIVETKKDITCPLVFRLLN